MAELFKFRHFANRWRTLRSQRWQHGISRCRLVRSQSSRCFSTVVVFYHNRYHHLITRIMIVANPIPNVKLSHDFPYSPQSYDHITLVH